MQIGKIVERLRSSREGRYAALVLGVVVIFGLGVVTGEGHLRLIDLHRYSSVTGLPKTIDYSSVDHIYDTLRANYDGTLTESQILDGLKHGLANATKDPYTEYFTAKEAKAFDSQLQGISLTGVGAQLDQDASGNVVVMSPLKGSPAAAAGLHAKDIIVTIDGTSAAGMTAGDAATKIRGPKGTKVTLVIQRGQNQLTFTITRDTISVPTAISKVLDDGVGYLGVSQFSDNTYELVQQAVTTFQQQGVKKVILDLRDNPGGEVESAKNISSLWLPDNALIMQEKRGNQVVDSTRATGHNPLKGIPTVVLVNSGSASAAEITALALRDGKAATIMGEKSYGKGVVQEVLSFSDGSELKVTIAKWYSPNGTSINHKGIKPDTVVTQSDADTKDHIDTQLQAAKTYLENK